MKLKWSKKLTLVISSIIAVFSLLGNLFLINKVKDYQEKETFKVINVFDGDTFYLENQQKVRLLNCDAPELKYCGGEEAKKRLEELILGKKVKVEWVTTDKFGRSIALVYQGKNYINKIMVKEGWVFYEGRKFEGSDEFVQLTRDAREQGKGIYQPRCYQKENPTNPKCSIAGNLSRNTGEKLYHFPGCSNYVRIIVEKFMGDDWFCTEEEAQKAGYTKSKNCYDKSFQGD